MVPIVTVYSKPECVQCDRTKAWLDSEDPRRGNMKGLYKVVDITEDAEALAAIKALGYMSAPVVIIGNPDNNDDETHWYGFRPDMLAQFARNPQTAAA
jgi:glutaredoxin-like protein NrdH